MGVTAIPASTVAVVAMLVMTQSSGLRSWVRMSTAGRREVLVKTGSVTCAMAASSRLKAWAVNSPPTLVAPEESFAKGALDTRSYRLIELSNGLRCLLVSENGADTCAAAIEVSAGSLDDPDAYPGLAHLTEHSLFLGTKLDPRDDGWERTISSVGGSSNAFTDGDVTRYFFDAPSDALSSVLVPWTAFFARPLLDDQTVRREIGAIDAEHAKNLRSDAFRISQLESWLRQPQPYNKFATGDRETLDKPGVVDALRQFFAARYVARDMACVVFGGKESLDRLQTAVAASELANIVPAPPVAQQSSSKTADYYLRDASSYAILAESLATQRSVRISWPLEYDGGENGKLGATQGMSETFAAHVLGHEGPKSLLAQLRSANLATALSAGVSDSTDEYRVFEIGVEVTGKGLKRWREVADACCAHVRALGELSSASAPAWPAHVINEPTLIANVAFQWAEPPPASSVTNGLVGKLRRRLYSGFDPGADLLKVGAVPLVDDLDRRARRFVLRLAHTEPLVTVVGIPPDQLGRKEPIYGTRFDTLAYRPSLTSAFSASFPAPNPYAPSSSFVPRARQGPMDAPPVLLPTSRVNVWLSTENRGTPRASCLVLSRVAPETTARGVALRKLWRAVLVESLRDAAEDKSSFRSYDASLAGYGWDLAASTQRGMIASFGGYADKLPRFVKTGLEAILRRRNFAFSMPLFLRVKDAVTRDLEREATSVSPATQGVAALTRLIEPNKFDPKAQLTYLTAFGPNDVARYDPYDAGVAGVDVLLSGDFDADRAQTVADILRDSADYSLPLKSSSPPIAPRLRLAPQAGSSATALVPTVIPLESPNVDETNVASILHFQTGGGRRARILVLALAAIVEPRFYESLRTKQQLGYIVQASPRNKEGLASLVFLVQSTSAANARALTCKIESFITDEFRTVMNQLSQREFDQIKKGLLDNLRERPNSLVALTSRFWDEIVAQTQDWSRRQKDAELLATLTTRDVAAFFQEAILGPNRRALAFEVDRYGQRAPLDEKRVLVSDLDEFASSMKRAPSLLDLESIRDDDFYLTLGDVA